MLSEDFTSNGDVLKSLLLTSFVCLWLYWLWSRRNLYIFALKFPGSFGYPIIGSLLSFKNFKYILPYFGNLTERFKSHTICTWLGFYPTVVSTDPEFIEKVLSSPDLLNKAKALYLPMYRALGGGIIASQECEWHHNRKMINPSFHHKVLLSFLPVFNKGKELTISLMDSMVDSHEHKLADMIQRISLGIAVETTMGKHMKHGEKLSDEFTEKFRFMLESMVVHLMLSCMKLDKVMFLNAKYNNVKNYLHKYILKLINLRIDNLKETPQCAIKAADDSLVSVKKSPKIFIDQAIQIYEKQQFSLKDIIVESNTILAGSFETTANGIFSALVMLATHPDIQERLFDEIVNVFPEKDFEMQYEHMQQLPYLDMVINETLRLAPSIPLIGRQVVHDSQLTKDLVLPKGLQIIISIFHVHRRKDIWGENADQFDPDHFLPENLAGQHAYSYIPFSKGQRNCIGWRYALFAMKVILSGILRNYRLSTSMKYEDLVFIEQIALKYLHEPLFQIHRREK